MLKETHELATRQVKGDIEGKHIDVENLIMLKSVNTKG